MKGKEKKNEKKNGREKKRKEKGKERKDYRRKERKEGKKKMKQGRKKGKMNWRDGIFTGMHNRDCCRDGMGQWDIPFHGETRTLSSYGI